MKCSNLFPAATNNESRKLCVKLDSVFEAWSGWQWSFSLVGAEDARASKGQQSGEDSGEPAASSVQNVLLLVSGEGGVTGSKLLQKGPFQKFLRIPFSTSYLSNAAVITQARMRIVRKSGRLHRDLEECCSLIEFDYLGPCDLRPFSLAGR